MAFGQKANAGGGEICTLFRSTASHRKGLMNSISEPANPVQPLTRDLVERTLVSAMALNPLVALDRGQLLAAAGRVAARAVARPKPLGARTTALLRELGQIAIGRSAVAPPSSDRRLVDPALPRHPNHRPL